MSSQMDLPLLGNDGSGKRTPRRKSDDRRRPSGQRDGAGGGNGSGGGGEISGNGGGGRIPDTSLAREAERRYLTYALSVITARALPDVRDGLKPVQRRILYAMLNDLGLRPDGRFRKSAAVVGDVMGKYHPHGDQAIYDAMVRMAQPFVMRAPLVEGQGNYGSPDGDGAAAMRYTEARLRPLAMELLDELGKATVGFRPNYDGTRDEPIVLPARFPNLLVNGSYGIAVGMATSIPPHNLGEVIDACVAMIDEPDQLTTRKLLKHIKGPDFPTGGQLLCSKNELAAIYEAGQGTVKLRGEWVHEPAKRRGDNDSIVLTSIPYAVERGAVVEKIAEAIVKKKLPALLDVRDESTEETRVVLEIKRGTDPQLVMAYLYKNTPLQSSVSFNLTCLVPVEDSEVAAPARLSLQEMLQEFLTFRFDVVTRRLEWELAKLLERIHILEGFAIVFDALDQAIKIIRNSDGKADAANKLIGRFGLSATQADAVLELKLYRLSKLEILAIQKELAEKRAEAKKIKALLRDEKARWRLVRDELSEIKSAYADPKKGGKRRTQIVGVVDEPEFAAEDFIVEEDAMVILMASGWVKRVRSVKDVNQTRMREGDVVLSAGIGSTKASVAFFSNLGTCYVTRVNDIPASTGYGEPIQTLFKLGDGERMVAMMVFDERVLEVKPAPIGNDVEVEGGTGEPLPPYALAISKGGLGLRFSLRNHAEPSTRAGRRFARPRKGDEILNVVALGQFEADDYIMCAASDGHALAVRCDEVSLLSGPGQGVMVMKLEEGVELLGAELGHHDLDQIIVVTDGGKERKLTLQSIIGSRAGKGNAVIRRGGFKEYLWRPAETPSLGGEEG